MKGLNNGKPSSHESLGWAAIREAGFQGYAKGAVLSGAELVDGAPTYAKVLGVELKNADGRPLTELIKSGDE